VLSSPAPRRCARVLMSQGSTTCQVGVRAFRTAQYSSWRS
jgi:hypothetical protein